MIACLQKAPHTPGTQVGTEVFMNPYSCKASTCGFHAGASHQNLSNQIHEPRGQSGAGMRAGLVGRKGREKLDQNFTEFYRFLENGAVKFL
jgi:hypothetical protein